MLSARRIVSAWWSAHHTMPFATLGVVPWPEESKTFAARTLARLTPATPRALPLVAATMPAMCVPWPASSDAFVEPSSALYVATGAGISGCGATPESTRHALAAPPLGHAPYASVVLRPHCQPSATAGSGALGVAP